MIFRLFCVLLFSVSISAGEKKSGHVFRKIPSFLTVCHRSNPDLSNCVKNSVEKLRPYLVKGIPEFGIPPCEPMLIPEIVINQGKGPVSVQSTYTNIHITGASQFIIKSIKVDPSKDRARFKLWLPFLHMISDYELDGKILMLPISGSGVCEGNYTNIEAHVFMGGEKFEKRGQTFFHVSDFVVRLNVGNATVQLNDLFNGDRELGDAMNLFLNENWDAIVQEVKPVLEDTIADMFKTFANNIYHKYPLDSLLPP